MKTAIHVSLHDLDAADLGHGYIHASGTVSVVVGNAATQLHWRSFEAFEAWVDRLHSTISYLALLAQPDAKAVAS